MGIHEAGAEIRQALENGIARGMGAETALVRVSLQRKIEEITSGQWTGFDLNVFSARITELGGRSLSEASLHLLKDLLTSQFSDTRNTALHMVERGVLTWDKELGTIVMPAAAELDRTLPERSPLLPTVRNLDDEKNPNRKEYYNKVTVIEARRQKETWEATRQ
jgi:hypothetical protein